MADKRNRSIELINLLTTEGITVNVAKNKALGNKGFFKSNGNSFRIDVTKGLDEDEIIRVLIHEAAHYVHFKYDKTLKNIDFIIKDFNQEIQEEMIQLTVDLIPKEEAKKLFQQKISLNSEMKSISESIKGSYPDFKISKPYKKFEIIIQKKGYGYLIKYDRVKVLKGFSFKILSIEKLDDYFSEGDDVLKLYLLLKSKQRMLRRVNARINKLNKYYNSTSELFARSIEVYFTDEKLMKEKAPLLKEIYDNFIFRIPLFQKISKILCKYL